MRARPARPEDAAAMARVLNAVIALGGTTAHEHPKTEAQVREDYVGGADVLSSVVAEVGGEVIGWQSVGRWQGEAHIGTFVQPGLQAKGIGAGLFAATLSGLRDTGIRYIIHFICGFVIVL